jgi:hypothetical protein
MTRKTPAKKRASASQTPEPPFFGTLQEWQDFVTAVEAMKPSAKRDELAALGKQEIARISGGERTKPVSMGDRWKMDAEDGGWGRGIDAAD